MKLFFLGLFLLISFDLSCQEDSVIVKKFNENYVEIQSLRFILDSMGRCPVRRNDGCAMKYDFRPKRIVLKDGIVLIKNRDNKPLQLLFYNDSIVVQDNYFKSDGILDYQDFEGDKNDNYVVLFWNNEQNISGIHYFFKKNKMYIQYKNDRTPEITIEPQ